MLKAFRGLAAVLAVTVAPAALAPQVVLAQSSPPAFDTRTAPQPLDIPRPPPPISAFFPDRAQRMEISGQAAIDCASDADGVLTDCRLISETPADWDFGAAALKAARARSIRKISTTPGGRVVVPVIFDAQSGGVSGGTSRFRPDAPRRVAGAAVAAQVAAPGQRIVAFPFAFTRTAVLTEDLTNVHPVLKVTRVKAGAPGFFVGRFGAPQNPSAGVELWCFLSSKDSAPVDWLCSLMLPSGSERQRSLVADGLNPYDVTSILTSNRDKQSYGPVFEEKPVEIPGDLRLEYLFKRWTPKTAEIEVRAGGRWSRNLSLQRRADGSTRLETLAGAYRLAPAPDAPSKVQISGQP